MKFIPRPKPNYGQLRRLTQIELGKLYRSGVNWWAGPYWNADEFCHRVPPATLAVMHERGWIADEPAERFLEYKLTLTMKGRAALTAARKRQRNHHGCETTEAA